MFLKILQKYIPCRFELAAGIDLARKRRMAVANQGWTKLRRFSQAG